MSRLTSCLIIARLVVSTSLMDMTIVMTDKISKIMIGTIMAPMSGSEESSQQNRALP